MLAHFLMFYVLFVAIKLLNISLMYLSFTRIFTRRAIYNVTTKHGHI